MSRKSVNRVTLVGNLGQDPELRYTPGGTAVANISVATTDSWTDKSSGEPQEHTEWHRVVFFGRLAEIVRDCLCKGAQIYVEGRLRTNKWQDGDGIDRKTTEVVANELMMLGSRKENRKDADSSSAPSRSSKPSSQKTSASKSNAAMATESEDDDIPF